MRPRRRRGQNAAPLRRGKEGEAAEQARALCRAGKTGALICRVCARHVERRLSFRTAAFLYDKGENYELFMSSGYRSPERLSF